MPHPSSIQLTLKCVGDVTCKYVTPHKRNSEMADTCTCTDDRRIQLMLSSTCSANHSVKEFINVYFGQFDPQAHTHRHVGCPYTNERVTIWLWLPRWSVNIQQVQVVRCDWALLSAVCKIYAISSLRVRYEEQSSVTSCQNSNRRLHPVKTAIVGHIL